MEILNEKELLSIDGGNSLYDAASQAFWIAKGSTEVAIGGVGMIAGVATADPLLVAGGAASFSDGMLDIGTNM
ncbi:hypothetical protein [Clostridium sp.]|uniref:hypothetical protein n=1 Tax=Clostridium sp. TaxID=1506 RepID=UPI0026248D1D|nr:hypothetical protein [Clostridium sp.]